MDVDSRFERLFLVLGIVMLVATSTGVMVMVYRSLPRHPDDIVAEWALFYAWTTVLPLIWAVRTHRAFVRLLRANPAVPESTLKTLGRARYWPLVIGPMALGLAMFLIGRAAR